MAYFAGDSADIERELAEELVTTGFAVPVDALRPESDLPDTLPGRKALIREGLYTREQVLLAGEALSDIPGIGRRTAEGIVNQLRGDAL